MISSGPKENKPAGLKKIMMLFSFLVGMPLLQRAWQANVTAGFFE
jgi:hypothetical protein